VSLSSLFFLARMIGLDVCAFMLLEEHVNKPGWLSHVLQQVSFALTIMNVCNLSKT